jgi:hypothetical protein
LKPAAGSAAGFVMYDVRLIPRALIFLQIAQSDQMGSLEVDM